MRKILKLATAALTLWAAVGCQMQPAPKQATSMVSRSALDVHPNRRPAPTYVGVTSATPPEEPVAEAIVTPVVSETPAVDDRTPVSAKAHSRLAARGKQAGGYQVKKGDTLYRIAKVQYGDPKKWTQIASANPGLTPQTLKVGQKIVLP